MVKSLSYVIFCWFFATSAYQRIFLVKAKYSLKFCESVRFLIAHGEIKTNPESELCEKESIHKICSCLCGHYNSGHLDY